MPDLGEPKQNDPAVSEEAANVAQPEVVPEEAEQTAETPAEIAVVKKDTELKQKIKEQLEDNADVGVCLSILHQNLADQEMMRWVIPIVHNEMVEKMGNAAPSVETLNEVAGLMQHLESSISQEDVAKMAEMAKDPKFEKLAEKRAVIIESLCMPVLAGHITAEDTASLVQNIALMEAGAPEQSKSSHGYEGVMQYDPKTGTIQISPQIIQEVYKNESGQQIKIDFTHLPTHEMAHGLVARTGLDREHGEQSQALVAKTKEIIAGAEKIKDSQPMHIRNVLDAMNDAKIAQEFGKIKDPKISSEDYKNQRILSAANEIITDYTAIYLQSDGSLKGFARVCIEKAETKSFKKYLAQTLGITEGPNQEELVTNKMRQIKYGLTEGKGGISAVLEKNPGLQQLLETYKVFYQNISAVVKDSRGNLAEDQEGDDDLEYYDFGEGGFMDSAGGFAQQDKSDMQKGDKFDFMGLVNAFAEEVETVTKPLSGPPAGMT